MVPGEEAVALAKERLGAIQQDSEAGFETLTARFREETDPAAHRETAAREASRMAKEAHRLALGLYRHFVYGEALPE